MATRKRKAENYLYDALLYSQRGVAKNSPEFILFHAPAGEIAAWADVERLSKENRTAAQRALRPMKVAKVKRFLAASPKNTIPTSVIVALDQEGVEFTPSGRGQGTAGKLRVVLDGEKKPGLIIDGQHRVFGANEFDPELPLNVIAIVGADGAERAFQFIVINNTPTKVSKDHVRALNLNYNPKRLNSRLVESAGVTLGMDNEVYEDLQVIDRSAPFEGMIKMPTNPKGSIPLNAIEAALDQVKERSAYLLIEEYEVDVFLQIWKTVSEVYAPAWEKGSRLLHKVSLYALTNFICENLEYRVKLSDELDLLDPDVLSDTVRAILQHVDIHFWTTPWKGTELDTSTGRRIVVEALKLTEANSRRGLPWHHEVRILDPSHIPRVNAKSQQSAKSAGAKKSRKSAASSATAARRSLDKGVKARVEPRKPLKSAAKKSAKKAAKNLPRRKGVR